MSNRATVLKTIMIVSLLSLLAATVVMALSGDVRSADQMVTPPAKSGPDAAGLLQGDSARLAAILPGRPNVITAEALRLMKAVASARQPEGALLLIKSLVFNEDPNTSNEQRTQEMLLPAIALLDEYYGESAAELLYQEGIGAEQDWYRNRIALAVRAILSPESRASYDARFELATSADDGASAFVEALASTDLDLHLAIPGADLINKLDEKVKQLREQNQGQ